MDEFYSKYLLENDSNKHLLDHFYCVTMISNPIRYTSRWKLYKRFEKFCLDVGVKLVTIELAFGERNFEITVPNNPFHIQLRTLNELWLKECALNLAINRLPNDWKYVAWVDADVMPTRHDWFFETVHQLQHYHIVQMFTHAVDLGPNHEIIQTHTGFAYNYHMNNCRPPQGAGYGGYYIEKKNFWHPGYAWAADRYFFDSVGGLMDFPILGAADHHMALALISEARRSAPKNISSRYMYEIMRWQERCDKFVRKDIGYVPSTINHWWHGKKKNRRYVERWDIITKNAYDPDNDIKRDSQGLWQIEDLTPRQIRFRDEVRQYFRQRNEDSIDLD